MDKSISAQMHELLTEYNEDLHVPAHVLVGERKRGGGREHEPVEEHFTKASETR